MSFAHSKQSVRSVQNMGKVCVLDIEIEGVKQIRNSDLNPILVFINPPSLQELEKRLRNRKTETEESLEKRLMTAKIEMEYGNNSTTARNELLKIIILICSCRYRSWQFSYCHTQLSFEESLSCTA